MIFFKPHTKSQIIMEVPLYEIRFECQTEAGIPDSESCSIYLTKEQYATLPVLSIEDIDSNSTITRKDFTDQIRNPIRSFPAIRISNPLWKLEQPEKFEDQYANPEYQWVLVYVDLINDIWIAFKYWNAATNADIMSYSSVGVSYPWHGDVYRIDESLKKIVDCFF